MEVPEAVPPSTMRAWQYSSTKGGIEKNLKINPSAPVPVPKPSQHLVQVIAIALNPIDHKPAEVPLIHRIAVPKPATPGIDYVGRIVTPARDTAPPLERGQLVFGVSGSNPMAGGALAEYAIVEREGTVAVADGIDALDAAIVGVAGLTAYQTIVPHVKDGDSVFINGGSGGTGVFGIQIAKAVGCHVTTTCSTANVELCKRLGADEVVDYKKVSVVETLRAGGRKFDHIVDNVGGGTELFRHCHEYSSPKAIYVMVGGELSLGGLIDRFKMKRLPGFLGGGKREFASFFAKANNANLEQIMTWMKEGKVKSVIDTKFPFEQAPQAFEKLKSGRAKGKIVIDVASET